MESLKSLSCTIYWCCSAWDQILLSDTATLTAKLSQQLTELLAAVINSECTATWAANEYFCAQKQLKAHRHVWKLHILCSRALTWKSPASASDESAEGIIAPGSWWTVRSRTNLFPLFSFLPQPPSDIDRRYGSTLCLPCMEINCILHSVSSVTNLLQ